MPTRCMPYPMPRPLFCWLPLHEASASTVLNSIIRTSARQKTLDRVSYVKAGQPLRIWPQQVPDVRYTGGRVRSRTMRRRLRRGAAYFGSKLTVYDLPSLNPGYQPAWIRLRLCRPHSGSSTWKPMNLLGQRANQETEKQSIQHLRRQWEDSMSSSQGCVEGFVLRPWTRFKDRTEIWKPSTHKKSLAPRTLVCLSRSATPERPTDSDHLFL